MALAIILNQTSREAWYTIYTQRNGKMHISTLSLDLGRRLIPALIKRHGFDESGCLSGRYFASK